MNTPTLNHLFTVGEISTLEVTEDSITENPPLSMHFITAALSRIHAFMAFDCPLTLLYQSLICIELL